MRLTCTSCGKVYVVDEGLRGRAFRMRCKRCDAVIAVGTVESPAAPAPGPQAPGAVTDRSPTQSPVIGCAAARTAVCGTLPAGAAQASVKRGDDPRVFTTEG